MTLRATMVGMAPAVDRRRFLALLSIAGTGGAAATLASQTVGSGAAVRSDEPAVAEILQEQPHLPERGSHRVIWAIDTDEPMASLTFDDGPDPEFTPRILEILGRYDVKATFFMMGWNARQHPGLAQQVVAAGHEIGNHTWTHHNLAFATPDETVEQMNRGAAAIEEVTGVRPIWFRPPRGQLSGFAIRQAAVLGTDTVIWSVDRGAPTSATAEGVRRHLGENFGMGDIVNLHDGLGRGTFNPARRFTANLRHRREVEIEALPGVIEDAFARGLQLGTVSELVAVERGAAHTTGTPAHPDDVVDLTSAMADR